MLIRVVRRVLGVIPLLLSVTVVVFLMVRLIPGDPALSLAGENPTEEQVAAIRERLGLDAPLHTQYFTWLLQVLQGDLGASLFSGRPVIEELSHRAPVTISLIIVAVVFGTLAGSIGGLLSGLRPGSVVDRLVTVVASVGIAIPNFWLGMILVSTFSFSLGLLPATGYTRLGDDPVQWFLHLVLPAVALGTSPAAEMMRQLRGGIQDVMAEPYITTAISKGLGPARVVGKHASKNVGVIGVTVIGIQVSVLLGQSVVVEKIFGLPGLGNLTVDAVLSRDMPIIQGIVLVTALMVVLTNIAVDLLYGYFNPKLRELDGVAA